MTKAGLRAELKARRDALSGSLREELSLKAARRVLDSPLWKSCRKLAIYCPVKSEADPGFLKRIAPEQGKTLLFPKCVGDRLEFFASDGESGFVLSRFGIPEPESGDPVRDFSDTLMIVPCLGVDGRFFRLGWGGGFYDRFFFRCRPMAALGFVFSVQEVPSVLPEEHDAVLDGFVSEKGLYLRS